MPARAVVQIEFPLLAGNGIAGLVEISRRALVPNLTAGELREARG